MDQQTAAIGEFLINVATKGVLVRIDERAARGRELYQWGLHPHHAQPGSPLAADDAAFEAAYPLALAGGVALTEEALFPAMSATENLNSAGILVADRKTTRGLHAGSIMQLCRAALEASARSIWLMSGPDEDTRRDRCLSLLMRELTEQSRFLRLEEEDVCGGKNPPPPAKIAELQSHRQNQADLVKRLKEGYEFNTPENFSNTIALAAKWVDDHVPAHDTGEIANSGLAAGAKRFYCIGSSFVHGYRWAVDYGRGGHLLGMIADGLAAAVNMTECAVALFEAACRGPEASESDELPYVPDRLRPTITAWTGLFDTV
jgi:hypothetical protein